MQRDNVETGDNQSGHNAHEHVSSPGQGTGGQDAPRQSGHRDVAGAYGTEHEHHPTPEGQVEAGQDQMSAGQTAESS